MIVGARGTRSARTMTNSPTQLDPGVFVARGGWLRSLAGSRQGRLLHHRSCEAVRLAASHAVYALVAVAAAASILVETPHRSPHQERAVPMKSTPKKPPLRVRVTLLAPLLVACGSPVQEPEARAPAPTETRAVEFENEAVHGYLARLPAGYSPERSYPLLIAFHGGGGSAESAHARWSAASPGFLLICPQGTARMGWQIGTGQLEYILACIDDALARFAADPARVYVTGHSMGGHVSWNLATFHALRFAAVAPTAAAPMFLDELDRLLDLPLYVVHGGRDNIVDLPTNRRAEQYVNSHGGSLVLTVVENAGHEFIEEQQDDIIEFFRRQR